jgi:RNA ligase
MFPTIRHIDDVLPAIAGRPEFTVGKRDGYTFIDYNYVGNDTFACPIRRECRGLKFDLEGNLIARPLHKFFNLHEKPDEIPSLRDGNHSIMEKLDGSMVHAVKLNGEVVFMTRAGLSAQAKMAMEACKRLPYVELLLDYCHETIASGATPIFEFTSPQNQIVVRYVREDLTLLAQRSNDTGYYAEEYWIKYVGRLYGIPVVRTYDQTADDMDAFVAHTKGLKDREGYVIRCEQWMGKMKADDYVTAHRAVSGLLFEKDVLRVVLEGKVDDVSGFLPSQDARDRLKVWADEVNTNAEMAATLAVNYHNKINEVALGILADPETYEGCTHRAAYAHALKQNLNSDFPEMRSWCFSILDGRDALAVIRAWLLKQTARMATARAALKMLNVPEWNAPSVDMEA